jgi:hypothetical protein
MKKILIVFTAVLLAFCLVISCDDLPGIVEEVYEIDLSVLDATENWSTGGSANFGSPPTQTYASGTLTITLAGTMDGANGRRAIFLPIPDDIQDAIMGATGDVYLKIVGTITGSATGQRVCLSDPTAGTWNTSSWYTNGGSLGANTLLTGINAADYIIIQFTGGTLPAVVALTEVTFTILTDPRDILYSE